MSRDFGCKNPRPPVLAKKIIPDWFKNIQEGTTLKSCMPFLDAMIAGYVIPFPYDLEIFFKDKDNIFVGGPGASLISNHKKNQYAGSFFSSSSVLKFLNPWKISTDQNVSVMFTQPMNNKNLPLKFFSGIVETDKYQSCVHFPAIIEDCVNETLIKINAGDPMIQLIPFIRESFEHEICRASEEDFMLRTIAIDKKINDHDYYKKQIHQKKKYD